MRNAVICAVLLVVVLPSYAGIDGAYVQLLDDYWLHPHAVTTIQMIVWYPSSARYECISDVCVTFTPPIILYPETIAYNEITAGRPAWDTSVDVGPYTGGSAWWVDSDGGMGEVSPGQATTIWIDATVKALDERPQSWPIDVHWEIWGDQGGYVDGWHVIWTPVEQTSWGHIKALYR